MNSERRAAKAACLAGSRVERGVRQHCAGPSCGFAMTEAYRDLELGHLITAAADLARPLPPPLQTPSEGTACRWRRADELTDSGAPTAATLSAERCGPWRVAPMPGLPRPRLPNTGGEAALWLFKLTAKPHFLLAHCTASRSAA